MDPRISLVTLGVTNLERSLKFYRDGLCWPLSSASVDGVVAFFRTGGTILALHPYSMLAQDAQLSEKRTDGFCGITLSHNVHRPEEVDAILQQAASSGGTILKAATTTDWGGVHGYFADCDGYTWEVAWNPGFPFNPDGSLCLPE